MTDGTGGPCRATRHGAHRGARMAVETQTKGGGDMSLEDVAAVLPEIIACPEPACLAPAEVVERFSLASTDGPIEHVKTRCLEGHGLTPRVASLAAWPVTEARRPLGASG